MRYEPREGLAGLKLKISPKKAKPARVYDENTGIATIGQYKVNVIMMQKPTHSISGIKAKWAAHKLLNDKEISRARKRGGLYAGKAGNRYKNKLRKYMIEYVTDEAERNLWLGYDSDIKSNIAKAENPITAITSGIGEGIGAAAGGMATGLVDAMKPMFSGISKNVKYILIGLVVVIGVSAGGIGAYKLSKVMRQRRDSKGD
jgi:hypothetical protein